MTKQYKLMIEHDDFAPNPRTEYDNLMTIALAMRDYVGDERLPVGAESLLVAFIEHISDKYNLGFPAHDYTQADINRILRFINNQLIRFTVSAYIHGTSQFYIGKPTCQFDSGLAGYIYAHKDDVRKEYGVKYVTKKVKEKVRAVADAELRQFSQYLNGEVYAYSIQDENGDYVEGCGGYYGEDDCRKDGESTLAYLVSHAQPE